MYGSLFREWKTAAAFVGGIAIMVAVFFSDGGGHEQLQLKRKQPEPVASAAPAPQRSATRYTPPVGFTPDEELQAAFEAPSEAATAPAIAEAIPAPIAEPAPVAEAVHASTAPQQLP